MSERNKHLTTVILSPLPPHISARGKTVHEFYGGVVPDLQPFCEFSNPWSRSGWKAFQSQHQLMLVGFEPYPTNGKLTKVEETANVMPQIGQRLEIPLGKCLFHDLFKLYQTISYYDISNIRLPAPGRPLGPTITIASDALFDLPGWQPSMALVALWNPRLCFDDLRSDKAGDEWE